MAHENDGVLEVNPESQQPEAGQPEGGGSGKPAKSKEDPAIAELRKEVAEYRKKLEETQTSERYWAEQARASQQPAAPKRKTRQVDADLEIEDDGDDDGIIDDGPDSFVNDLSTKGIEALVKRGVLTKKAAREMIAKEAAKVARAIVGQERQKMTAESELVTEFPELKDPNSELYKRTSEIYSKEIKADPALAKSPRALILAAKQAKLELQAKNPKRASDDDDFEDDDFDPESDRLNRIRAQQGERGTRRRRSGFEEGNDELDPAQRQIASAFGISEEEYKKFAQKVQIKSAGSAPAGRRR